MMHKKKIAFQDTGLFGTLFTDFINQKEALEGFTSPTIDNINLADFNISQEKRDTLIDVVSDQSSQIKLSSKSVYNLNILKEPNTYTVTTGHQLNLFGGPLFFTYKILATVKACQKLNAKYPKANFIPIYWAATEDHDFEEINHFYLFGKKNEWGIKSKETPVGDLTMKEFDLLLSGLKDIPENIKNCYRSSQTLKEAHIKLVYEMFGEYGLLCLDANDKRLKSFLIETATKEIINQTIHNTVTKTNQDLVNNGYKPQVNPRKCNLFHIENGTRNRIDIEDNIVKLVGTNTQFTKEQYLEKINDKPEVISPNVLLRPLYQQIILPNIAYIGGPGELAYWLQLKNTFSSLEVSYPALVPRFFALYLPTNIVKKMFKANLSEVDLFKTFEDLKANILNQDQDGQQLLVQLDQHFENYKVGLLTSLEKEVNLSLKSFAESGLTRMNKEHVNITKRVKKELEAKNSVKLDRIKSILNNLYPNGSMQERQESVFTFSINNPDFIEQIYNVIEPFDFRFNVLQDA